MKLGRIVVVDAVIIGTVDCFDVEGRSVSLA